MSTRRRSTWRPRGRGLLTCDHPTHQRSAVRRDTVALETPDGRAVALLQVREVFSHSKEEEAQLAYGTTDPKHPGVAQLYGQGDFLVGGDIRLLRRTAPTFPELALDPADTRRAFAERGWRTVVGFQTRNPVHRAHEYIQKAALETV